MPLQKHNKLVRDRVITHLLAKGEKVVYRVLAPEQRRAELREKLIEEVHEVARSRNRRQMTEELGDVLEAARSIAREHLIFWLSVGSLRDDLSTQLDIVLMWRGSATRVIRVLTLGAEHLARVGDSKEAVSTQLALLLNAMHAVAFLNGIPWRRVEQMSSQKRDERGGFKEGYYLISTGRR